MIIPKSTRCHQRLVLADARANKVFEDWYDNRTSNDAYRKAEAFRCGWYDAWILAIEDEDNAAHHAELSADIEGRCDDEPRFDPPVNEDIEEASP